MHQPAAQVGLSVHVRGELITMVGCRARNGQAVCEGIRANSELTAIGTQREFPYLAVLNSAEGKVVNATGRAAFRRWQH